MALTISNISAVLKKIIIPVIQNQLPKESVLFDKIKRNSGVTVANNTIYIAARTGKHSGIYNVAEGNEPYAGKAKYQQPYEDIKFIFGTLEITDQAIEAAANGDVKAIASILQTEITALKDDLKMDLNRQMHGAGRGKLCLTNGTGAASTALIVDGNPNGGDGTEYLVEGMYLHLGSTGAAAVQISSVDSATEVTLATAANWANDAYVCKGTGTTLTGATGSAVEIMGLAGIIDDGDNVATIHNITRSSYPWACAHVEDTAATLTEAQMIDLYLKTKRYGGSKVVFMGSSMFSKYGQLLTSMKKTADLKEVLSGGWKGLEFMDGVGVMLDFDTWNGYVQFVDFDALTIAEMTSPFQWLEADAHGGILGRSSSNRTIWEGTLKYYMNLVGKKFKSMGRLSGKQP
jgi:hypothetical protein